MSITEISLFILSLILLALWLYTDTRCNRRARNTLIIYREEFGKVLDIVLPHLYRHRKNRPDYNIPEWFWEEEGG